MSQLDDIFINPLGFYMTFDGRLSYGFVEDYDATEDIEKAKQQIIDLFKQLPSMRMEEETNKDGDYLAGPLKRNALRQKLIKEMDLI